MACNSARLISNAFIGALVVNAALASGVRGQDRTTKGAIAGGSIGLLTDGLDGALKGATLGAGGAAVTGGGPKAKQARKGAKTGAIAGGSIGLLTDGLGGALKGGVYGGAAGGVIGRKKKP